MGLNLLKNTTAYLAGPVEQDENCYSWRNAITPKLQKFNIKVWNPLIKPQWFIDTHQNELTPEKQKEDIQTLSVCYTTIYSKSAHHKIISTLYENQHIRNACLRLASACDFIICKVGTNTVGTFEELAIAKQQNKPVLFLMDKLDSCWRVAQFYNYHQIAFKNIEDLINYLSRINNGVEKVNNLEWIFLNGAWA